MLKNILEILILILIVSCSQAQVVVESHMMGHSLMDHVSSTDRTKIAFWIDQLSDEANHNYEMTGQFGSIWNFADFNPESNWGIPGVDRSWDGEVESFADASLNNLIFTVFNFVQDVPADEIYFTEPSSVLTACERLIDSVDLYQPNITQYIYENWPDMAPFTGDPFDPTPSDFEAYNVYTLGDFHDWWLDLQDLLLASDPAENVRMIPVGPMISELISSSPYNTIPTIDLYEDNAPHGRESIYFLAGLATYMAIFQEEAPTTYIVPNTVHVTIRNNYENIVAFFWQYLQEFNDTNGVSRVFVDITSSIPVEEQFSQLPPFPNPVLNTLNIDFILNSNADINLEIYNQVGQLVGKINKGVMLSGSQHISLDFEFFSSGAYLIRLKDKGRTLSTYSIIKH